MKKILFLILIMFLLSSQLSAQGNIGVQKFAQKKLELNLTYGSKYHINKSPDQYIYINVADTGNPDFKVEITDLPDLIVLKEINTKHNGNRPTPKTNKVWEILLPEYTELTGNGAMVDVEINNVNGIFKISSASGNVKIDNAGGVFEVIGASTDVDLYNLVGKFKVSVNNGNIHAKEITIVGKSKFVTNDGNINLILDETPENDILVSTGSGTGVLNFNGNDLRGEFTFKARRKYGRIISPIDFQKEQLVLDDIMHYEKRTDFGKKTEYDLKSFVMGSKTPKVLLSTITGMVKLKK